MFRKFLVGVALASSVATLVATSAPEFTLASAETAPVSLALSPEEPSLTIDAEVTASSSGESTVLELLVSGQNVAAASGRLLVYDAAEPWVGEPTPGSEQSSLVIAGAFGGPEPVEALLQVWLDEATGPQLHHLLLVLEGEAELVGEVTLRAVTISSAEITGSAPVVVLK